MANYKESNVTGDTWTRAYQVNISNPYQQQPYVTFLQEEITELSNGKLIKSPAPQVTAMFVPSEEIELINPETLEPLGQTMSKSMLYLGLFSEYMRVAQQYDASVAAMLAAQNTPPPEPDPVPDPVAPTPEPTPPPEPDPNAPPDPLP